MLENNERKYRSDYFFPLAFTTIVVILFLTLNTSATYKSVTYNDRDNITLTDEYSKQIETIQAKLKSAENSDIAGKEITFELTSRVLQPAYFSYDFNYTGLMPETITVHYTMNVEEAIIFLDNRYRQIKKDKNWYIAHDRLEEYNFNMAETVNTTREICRELKKEYHLFADDTWF